MVAVNVTPGRAYSTTGDAPAAAPLQADRATRGASIVTTGNISELPFVIWTWLTVPLLKPLPFRPETRRLSPNSDISIDLGVPRGG